MNYQNLSGAPLVAAIIVTGAIALLVGISITFSAHIQF